MNWRFADLPIRTKFLITLGIPVVGLVLLIGKQVDSNLKRSAVLGYVSKQAGNIKLIADVVDGLQNECAVSVATLEKVLPNTNALVLARSQSDHAIGRLSDPAILIDPGLRPFDVLASLEGDRKRVDRGDITARHVGELYRKIDGGLLRNLGEMSKQAVDLEVNARLFAHHNMLYAKDALSEIRINVLRSLTAGADPKDMGELNELISLYETSLLLFQRDAEHDLLMYFQDTYRGPEVNLLRSMLGVVRSKGTLADSGIDAKEWWSLSGKAIAQLRQVEDRSIDSIITSSANVAAEAKQRLVLVLAALLVVVGMVVVMATVITRGITSTIKEVTQAAAALARGDVRARVPLRTRDEVGQMAGSFNEVIDAMRSLSASADAIGQGNYDVSVVVRGEQDVLGHSLTRMRDNLRAARERDVEQNRALVKEKEKLEQANARIQVLIREIHHRVKNNLQVVSSMLRLQAGTIRDEQLRQSFAQSQSRVASMALIHEKLYKGDDLAQVDLSQYIKDLFTELIQLNKVEERIRYRTAIDPDLVLDLDTMVPLGLILNELITNSFKHAFVDGREGFINLRIHRNGKQEVDLHYDDNGMGIPEAKRNNMGDTLGRSLIDSLVEQINGRMTMGSDGSGTRYHIVFTTA
ncbi:MAG TPA: histidine kinase dimerization/phosphoacceptor domain -containing protein [Flavobacteriales bacterium]|nr:histidine kinase dimerization/phosphoacceptor domain -containing protein [Flavobacteriales bacterium]